ncbi:MAG: hypothetical protein AABZ47_10475 [Planctomycetota bacterium]
MVSQPNRLEISARAIEAALRELANGDEVRIRIDRNEWGHLEILVGSNRFKNVPEHERDEIVWKCLQNKLATEDFANISELLVLDLDRFINLNNFDTWVSGDSSLDPEIKWWSTD